MIPIYIYKLVDADGNESFAATTDPGENIRIGGADKNGDYRQFDTTEAYHLSAWAEPLGMKVSVAKVMINPADLSSAIEHNFID